MQKKNTSRFAINTFSEKAFELNNYSDHGFCSNYDGFKKLIKKAKKKAREYDEDIQDILLM